MAKQTLPKKRGWSHTLFAHLYDSRVVADKLKELYGADEGYKEPQSRESALSAVKFTADGLMIDDSLVLSSGAWFLGRALAGEDWTRGFDADQMRLREQIKSFMGGKVSAAALRGLTEYIRRFLGVDAFFGDVEARRLRFRSTPIRSAVPLLGFHRRQSGQMIREEMGYGASPVLLAAGGCICRCAHCIRPHGSAAQLARRCSGSRLKPLGLTFHGPAGSNYLQGTSGTGSL